MVTHRQAAALLKTLSEAYRDTDFERNTLQIYLDHLADIPLPLLHAAVEEHIKSSPWFPKISELRLAASRLAGTRWFDTLPRGPLPTELAAEVWPLILQAQAHEDAFYRDGTLDPAAWESLAAAFTRLDRPHRAAHTRAKFRRLQSLHAQKNPAN